MDTTETSVPETVHRSPHSFEIVEPTLGVDRPLSERTTTPTFEDRMADEPVNDAYRNSPNALFNSTEPTFAVLHEKPEHRIIVYLKAQGLSNNEIATRTGYTPMWISQVCRQPWFRLRLVQELKEAGIDAVQTTIRASALDSVFTLIELRDDVTAPKAVRKASADSLLDRYLGKPVQKLETEEKRLPSTPEITAIETELAEINKELKTTPCPLTSTT